MFRLREALPTAVMQGLTREMRQFESINSTFEVAVEGFIGCPQSYWITGRLKGNCSSTSVRRTVSWR